MHYCMRRFARTCTCRYCCVDVTVVFLLPILELDSSRTHRYFWRSISNAMMVFRDLANKRLLFLATCVYCTIGGFLVNGSFYLNPKRGYLLGRRMVSHDKIDKKLSTASLQASIKTKNFPPRKTRNHSSVQFFLPLRKPLTVL